MYRFLLTLYLTGYLLIKVHMYLLYKAIYDESMIRGDLIYPPPALN